MVKVRTIHVAMGFGGAVSEVVGKAVDETVSKAVDETVSKAVDGTIAETSGETVGGVSEDRQMSPPLDLFSPATREWFSGAFAAPTNVQADA